MKLSYAGIEVNWMQSLKYVTRALVLRNKYFFYKMTFRSHFWDNDAGSRVNDLSHVDAFDATRNSVAVKPCSRVELERGEIYIEIADCF